MRCEDTKGRIDPWKKFEVEEERSSERIKESGETRITVAGAKSLCQSVAEWPSVRQKEVVEYRAEWRGNRSSDSGIYRLIPGDEGLPKEANQGPIESTW